jgi:hypothetical protein
VLRGFLQPDPSSNDGRSKYISNFFIARLLHLTSRKSTENIRSQPSPRFLGIPLDKKALVIGEQRRGDQCSSGSQARIHLQIAASLACACARTRARALRAFQQRALRRREDSHENRRRGSKTSLPHFSLGRSSPPIKCPRNRPPLRRLCHTKENGRDLQAAPFLCFLVERVECKIPK